MVRLLERFPAVNGTGVWWRLFVAIFSLGEHQAEADHMFEAEQGVKKSQVGSHQVEKTAIIYIRSGYINLRIL